MIVVFIAILAAVFIIASYSSLTRPIWIDEFLHFALGSHRSSAEAWRSISETLPTFNFGQTGVLMMINYWMLHALGASSFWLRFPSMVAGAFLLLSAARIGLKLGFNLFWILLLLSVYYAQHNLMYYAGEARPYIFLAAAAVGTLGFYLDIPAVRSWRDRALGAAAIGLGVLFHPYFPLYWLALAVFGYVRCSKPPSLRTAVSEFVRHCDPVISVSATLVFFALAKLTWQRGLPDLNMDSFQWIRPSGLLNTFTGISHFEFLGRFVWFGVALLIAAAGAFGVPGLRLNLAYRRLAPPLLLIALALLLSFCLSAVSYRHHYWILPRQWVASMALICIGYTWFVFEFARFCSSLVHCGHIPCLVLFIALLTQTTRPVFGATFSDLRACFTQIGIRQNALQQEAMFPAKTPLNNDEWVAAANANILAGGAVWPLFRRFYGRSD